MVLTRIKEDGFRTTAVLQSTPAAGDEGDLHINFGPGIKPNYKASLGC